MTNRNPVKQLFITFPHSTVDKVVFRDQLLRFEPSYYKIAEEKHKDGTPHLHAVVKFKNKYSKAYVLKYFKELYPEDYKRIDVCPVRSITKSVEYLSKEDLSPLESGEYDEKRGKSTKVLNEMSREIFAMYQCTGIEDYRTRIAPLIEEQERLDEIEENQKLRMEHLQNMEILKDLIK